MASGEVSYKCHMKGCKQSQDEALKKGDDLLVVRRNTKVVRAVDIKTGLENWNFSVGINDVSYVKGGQRDDDIDDDDDVIEDTVESPGQVKIYPSSGLILCVDNDDTDSALWQYKFESPVVKAWILKDGQFNEVSIFDYNNVPALAASENKLADNPEPLIYLGVYMKQLYVLPSDKMRGEIDTAMKQYKYHHPTTGKEVLSMPRVKWQPYIASASSRTPLVFIGRRPQIGYNKNNLPKNMKGALIIREELEYPFDGGFYLYADHKPVGPIDDSDTDSDNSSFVTVINVSFWYWWKEVVAISIATSVFVHLMIIKYLHKGTAPPIINEPLPSDQSYDQLHKYDIKRSVSNSSGSSDTTVTADNFISRYYTDFEQIQCLGRGGFGVVFEAKNKIDECHYAIKRICVKNSPKYKEKVLREARALAKLENPGIVRYYQVWIETPPPGWQENIDKQNHDNTSSENPTHSCSVTSTSEFPSHIRREPELLNYGQNSFNSFRGLPRVQEEDSFEIVFRQNGDSQTQEKTNVSNFLSKNSMRSSSNSDKKIILEDSGCSTTSNTDISSSLNRGCSLSSVVVGDSSYSSEINSSPKKLYLYIQMQLCQRESLKDWLCKHTLNRDRTEILSIFDQIVSAVEYVHDCGLMHRDLKPSNIFFSKDGFIKIGDFGLVTGLDEQPEEYTVDNLPGSTLKKHTDQVGTQLYMSPEQINGQSYGQKVDVYSLGLIFLELLYPFSTQMERQTVLTQAKKLTVPHRFKRELPQECKLVESMLAVDPDERPTVQEIKDHSLLRSVDIIYPLNRTRTRSTSSSSSTSQTDNIPDISA